ncbi:MAG: hypothetical protein EOR46_08985 [Mesorhizobium sp.]|nr:hypothetical protein [Mesorhizobium sp.]RWK42963.1 MAG: hypothetical protein EOR46_08985 [Mesorhizobium sp.]RWK70493.1 MAG: hypothetical protein EOR54_04860 [Mesorhizobium sp.]RWK80756.1 MAG: hypothetical protein EOR50_03335 [Mesorhizobium sp.]RWK83312.1 MAG: hypothetical protein EOR51_08395 [Mesorhizobium sp.]RWL09207.1 MAG: hypothetical protein EOR55_01885 [Mesorhizobium sp.]
MARVLSSSASCTDTRSIGENLELLQEIAGNLDNIDYGEMIYAHDGTDEGITTFTESLKEFLADVRTWEGGVRQFLLDSQCDLEMIERIVADEPKSELLNAGGRDRRSRY